MSSPPEQSFFSAEMLTVDVVASLRRARRHGTEPARGEQGAAETLARLAAMYKDLGLEVPEATLKAGMAANAAGDFLYAPPRGGLLAWLARLYVVRAHWQRQALGVLVVLVLGIGGYFLAYLPYRAARIEAAHIELTKTLPARMDALYQTVFNETKVQSATAEAAQLRREGKAAAARGDRDGAEAATAALRRLRDRVRASYTLEVVSSPGVNPAFWTFPAHNSEATNYYIVVTAVGRDGQPQRLPIRDAGSGETSLVSKWGLRVPESVYSQVMTIQRLNGTVDHYVVGIKQFGFLNINYLIPVFGATVTKW